MIKIEIKHGHPLEIFSEKGKYKQRLHLWVDSDGIINQRALPNLPNEVSQ